MRISVIGCGYLGAVHAASMSEFGHEVVGIDLDEQRVAALAAGRAPFYEPGLAELLERSLASGRLRFTTDSAQAEGSRVHFVAVGTPQLPGEDAADLRFVDAAVESLLPVLAPGDLVVGKSTVPVGTARRLANRIAERGSGAALAWNPEFLREGHAIDDTLRPDRLVYGLPDEGADDARDLLDEAYAGAVAAGTPVIATDLETAELVKAAANAFLATKISFINAMAEVCEVAGGDVTALADALGFDSRIGRRFLDAGLGFGGGCLPKDLRAFVARASELGAGDVLRFLREVDQVNVRQRSRAVELARELLGGSVLGSRIAILGVAFKPDSDDVRDSPALNVAAQLSLQGASVICHDPRALANARRRFPELRYTESLDEAVNGADAIMVLTEWADYRALEPSQVGRLVAQPNIIDGRNCIDPESWRRAGWNYRALGRPRDVRTMAFA